ncbi:MAG: class I SAM-dependent methyltransferase [Alphaproteobacteria bacterium]
MQQHQNSSSPFNAPPLPLALTDTGAAEKWSAMERHMAHPLLQSLRGIKKGTLRVYLPDESEVFYLGADPGSHANIHFHDWKSLDRIVMQGEVALGEDYAAGLWHTSDLKNLMRLTHQNGNIFDVIYDPGLLSRLARLAQRKLLARPPGPPRKKNFPTLSNDFYRLWLDQTMTFSGALFLGDDSVSMEDAQCAKHRRALGRLDLQPGQHVLDIGCGWGAFMEEAARSGIRTTGVTMAAEQAAYAKERLTGFSDLTEIRLEDYRLLTGQYDGIVSLGMFERIGEAAWQGYMNCIFRNLRPGGRALIQTAVIGDQRFEDYRTSIDFMRKHIIPGGMYASRRRLTEEAERAGLIIHDVYNFGRDQAITFDRWHDRFSDSSTALREMGYSSEFIRKWQFYLASSTAMFASECLDVLQIELLRPSARPIRV